MIPIAPTNSIQSSNFSFQSGILQRIASRPLGQERETDTGRSHLPHKVIPGWHNMVHLHQIRSFFLIGATTSRRIQFLTTQFAEAK